MPYATWPLSLPQLVLRDGYTEKPGDNTIETPVDAGPAKARRRFTASVRRFSASVKFSAAQMVTFEEFWGVTLADGSLPFEWKHPRTQADATLVFRKPHWSISEAVGGNVIVQLNLERLT